MPTMLQPAVTCAEPPVYRNMQIVTPGEARGGVLGLWEGVQVMGLGEGVQVMGLGERGAGDGAGGGGCWGRGRGCQ